MARSTAAGKDTLAYCTSCKMDLNHIVVAMKGDKIVKVECQTCKKTHAYKAPKGVTEPEQETGETKTAKVKGEKKKKKDKDGAEGGANPIEAEWQKLMTTHKDAPTKNYSTKGRYQLGDKINHPNFGEGIVGRLIYPNKLEVIFRADLKVLIHAGAPTA